MTTFYWKNGNLSICCRIKRTSGPVSLSRVFLVQSLIYKKKNVHENMRWLVLIFPNVAVFSNPSLIIEYIASFPKAFCFRLVRWVWYFFWFSYFIIFLMNGKKKRRNYGQIHGNKRLLCFRFCYLVENKFRDRNFSLNINILATYNIQMIFGLWNFWFFFFSFFSVLWE